MACDDEGRTGRSLSLVSRYIHDVSEDIKYRSLAIWGMPQILRCHDVLLRKPPHIRRIIHLFISAHEQVRPGEEGPIEEHQWAMQMHYVRSLTLRSGGDRFTDTLIGVCVPGILWHPADGCAYASDILSMFLHLAPHSPPLCANAEPSRVHSFQWISCRPNNRSSIR